MVRPIFETHLEEYKALRAEILHRLELQYRITNYAAVLFIGTLTAVVSIVGSGVITRNLYFIILIIPCVFYVFALAYREQDFMIINLAEYINIELTPQIADALCIDNEKIFGWDRFFRGKVKWSLIDLIRGNSRYIFLFMPNLIFLFIFFYFTVSLNEGIGWAIHEQLLFAGCLLMLIDPILVIISTTKRYIGIAKKAHESNKN